MTYRPDRRNGADLLAAVLERAAAIPVPGTTPDHDVGLTEPPNWRTVLDNDNLSAALVEALLTSVGGLLDHLALLPERSARHWLERSLGIAALPARPAAAVVTAALAKGHKPVLLPTGTKLRGPKAADGKATTFRTMDDLTVTGARVAALRSHATWTGGDVAVDSGPVDQLPADPISGAFTPFPENASARQEMILCSELLAFSGGTLEATVEFQGVTGDVSVLANLDWSHSTSDGEQPVAALSTVGDGRILTLTLDGGCRPRPIPGDVDGSPPHCYLKVAVPADQSVTAARGFGFNRVRISVHRSRVQLDGAYFNDGLLDIEREFAPFGDVPKRGDGFYLQCDEALAKPLEQLEVFVEPLSEPEYNFLHIAPLYYYFGPDVHQQIMTGEVSATVDLDTEPTATAADASHTDVVPAPAERQPAPAGFQGEEMIVIETNKAVNETTIEWIKNMVELGIPDPPSATIEWEYHNGDSWVGSTSTNRLSSTGVDVPPAAPASHMIELAGVSGRFIRAFLRAGDFGWDQYLKDLAAFGTATASGNHATMPVAPKPPMLRTVSLSYTTAKVFTERVVSRIGHSVLDLPQGARPFIHPLGAAGSLPLAAVYVGLDVDEAALGASLSISFDVDNGAACRPLPASIEAKWQAWSGRSWVDLAVADAGHGLRTSGLVRFVAPTTWPRGCPEVSDHKVRWIRLVTNAADLVGTINHAAADAVVAVADPGPDGRVVELTDVPAEKLKGPSQRIAGVDKLVNPLPGTASRPPESDHQFVARAPQMVRTRNRLVTPQDYELHVRDHFPEVAWVKALPHFDPQAGEQISPGVVSLVVIPHSTDPAPLPSADLITRIGRSLEGRTPVQARAVVICPVYRRLNVAATIVLAPGEPALTARSTIAAAIDGQFHPLQATEGTLGQPVYRSQVINMLEELPVVDRIDSLELLEAGSDDGTAIAFSGQSGNGGAVRPERIEPPTPAKLGMIVSGGSHHLLLTEQLS